MHGATESGKGCGVRCGAGRRRATILGTMDSWKRTERLTHRD